MTSLSPRPRRASRSRTGIASCRAGVSPYQTGSPSRQIRPWRVRDVQVRHLGTADDPADLVVLVRGRRGGRAHLGDAEERPRLPVRRAYRHPEQQVGEGQVGQQLPVAGEPVQVVDVGRAEAGVLLGEIAQRGHGAKPATPLFLERRGDLLEAARGVRVLAAGQRQRQRQPLQRQDVQQRRVPLVDRRDGEPAGRRRARRPAPTVTTSARRSPSRLTTSLIAAPPGPEPTTASTGTSGSVIASGPCSRSAPEKASAGRYEVSISFSAVSRAVG